MSNYVNLIAHPYTVSNTTLLKHKSDTLKKKPIELMKTLCLTKTLEMLKINIITHMLHLLYFRENNISFTDNKCRIYHFVYAFTRGIV
jgi:hypothetical protein